jgi:hypothetical protein
MNAVPNRGESVGLMEPMLIGETSRHRPGLADLALELAQRSAGLRRPLPRADLAGSGERQARRVASALAERGALVSESTRAPLRLAFPAALAGRWMPGRFPERAG